MDGGDSDDDLLFAQDTSISGQFVHQWQLRIRAQEAALKEIANSKLRRPLAYNKTFDSVFYVKSFYVIHNWQIKFC